jgi:hypothetical protein
MFDFETLQKIDSPLLNRTARDLKWPVMDRLKESANMVKGLALPAFEAKLVQAVSTEQATENIRPRLSKAPPENTLLVMWICSSAWIWVVFHKGRRARPFCSPATITPRLLTT